MSFTALVAASLFALAPAAQDAAPKSAPQGGAVAAKAAETAPNARLLAMIGPELEKADGTTVPTKEALEGRKNVLIYFTASWCGPCRRFTPDLVKFAKANADAKDFLIIMVGSDRSEDAQRAYMKKSEMPFLAVPFTAEGRRKVKQAYAGGGIPNLVILDDQGVALKGSYETDGKYTPKNRNSYIGPFAVLEHFTKQHAEAVKKAKTGAA